MRVEETFTLPLRRHQVWPLVTDLDIVTACMPGAALTGTSAEGKRQGTITVTFGPTRVVWRGELTMDVDQGAGEVLVDARGKDGRGQSQARAKVRLLVSDDGTATRLDLRNDVEVAGVLAGFAKTGGEPILRTITSDFRMNLETYAASVAASTAGAAEVTPGSFRAPRDTISVSGHLWRGVADWFRRLFRQSKSSGTSQDGS